LTAAVICMGRARQWRHSRKVGGGGGGCPLVMSPRGSSACAPRQGRTREPRGWWHAPQGDAAPANPHDPLKQPTNGPGRACQCCRWIRHLAWLSHIAIWHRGRRHRRPPGKAAYMSSYTLTWKTDSVSRQTSDIHRAIREFGGLLQPRISAQLHASTTACRQLPRSTSVGAPGARRGSPLLETTSQGARITM